MSNSARWRKLMQWIQELIDTNEAKNLNFVMLLDKIDRIKRGEKCPIK